MAAKWRGFIGVVFQCADADGIQLARQQRHLFAFFRRFGATAIEAVILSAQSHHRFGHPSGKAYIACTFFSPTLRHASAMSRIQHQTVNMSAINFSTSGKRVSAAFLLALCMMPFAASAQPVAESACGATAQITAAQLHGLWRVVFTSPPAGLPAQASLLLRRHAEFSDSLGGTVTRELPRTTSRTLAHAGKAAIAGDFEDGMLLLDESSDNISITGTWNGQLVTGSCGRAFEGVWKDTSASALPEAPDVPFILRKLP
jgi:hypothetical protein